MKISVQGAAGAGVAHLPEIVLAEVVDVIIRQPGDLLPNVGGLRIARNAGGGIALVAAYVQAASDRASRLW